MLNEIGRHFEHKIFLTATPHNGRKESFVAFLELGWTPADHEQAEDRAHRIGQLNPVNVWYLLGANTVDEMVWNVLRNKQRIVAKATDGGMREVARQVISDMRKKRQKTTEAIQAKLF